MPACEPTGSSNAATLRATIYEFFIVAMAILSIAKACRF